VPVGEEEEEPLDLYALESTSSFCSFRGLSVLRRSINTSAWWKLSLSGSSSSSSRIARSGLGAVLGYWSETRRSP